jgi:hypothetical protein
VEVREDVKLYEELLRLVVWSRNEVVRIDFEDCWNFRPGLADDLIGRSPFQGLRVLGEVVGGDEGQNMGLQAVRILVVEGPRLWRP